MLALLAAGVACGDDALEAPDTGGGGTSVSGGAGGGSVPDVGSSVGGGDSSTSGSEGSTSDGIDTGSQGTGGGDTVRRWVAVGESGQVLTSEEANIWTSRESGVDTILTSVVFQGAAYFALGSEGVALRSTDGGETWDPLSSGTTSAFRHAAAGSNLVVGLVGPHNEVFYSADEGETWFGGPSLDLDGGSLGIPVRFGNGRFVARGTRIRWSVDAIEWSGQAMAAGRGLGFADGWFWTSGPNQEILRSSDGETWETIAQAAECSDLARAFVVAHDDRLFCPMWYLNNDHLASSADGGQTWSRVVSLDTLLIDDVGDLHSDGIHLVAVGNSETGPQDGAIWITENGDDWTTADVGSAARLHAVTR